MRKFLLGLALLAPVPAVAQTLPQRGQSGYDTGPIVACIGLDGVSPARCLMPGRVLYDPNGVPIGTATNPIYTSGGSSTRTTAAGTSDTQAVPVQGVTGGIPQRATRADDSAIASEATLGTLFKSGQSIGALPTGTNTIGTVNLGTLNGASTAANQSTQITAEQAIQANQTATGAAAQTAQGNVADGSADAGNPIKMGARAVSSRTTTTANSRVDLMTDLYRSLFVRLSDGSGNGLVTAGPVSDTYTPTNLTPLLGTFSVGAYYDPVTGNVPRARGNTTGAFVVLQPDSTASAGITPVSTQGATSNTVKASAGNLYSVNVVNSTVAGFLVVYNANTAPPSGTTINAANALYCMPVSASVGFRDSFLSPIYGSTGLVLLMSTSCTTYTPIGTAPITLTGQAK